MGQEVHPIINSFNNGEGSPLLDGRTDLAKYKSLNKTVENFLVSAHGPAMNCPGFKYIAETKDSTIDFTLRSRLMPFKFSETQTYMLEFGNLYIRFYKDQAQLEIAAVPYEIVTPYTNAQLPAIKFAQSADVMYLVHPDHAPRKLLRFGDTDWRLDVMRFLPPPTTIQEISPAANLTLSNLGISANVVTIVSSASIFREGDIGKEIIEDSDIGEGRFLITAYVAGTQVTGTVFSPFVATSLASGNWKLLSSGSSNLRMTTDLASDNVGAAVRGVTVVFDENMVSSADEGKYLKAFGGIFEINQIPSATIVEVITNKRRTDGEAKDRYLQLTGDTDGATGIVTITAGGASIGNEFNIGDFVLASAGFAITERTYEIISIDTSAATVTIDATSNAVVVGMTLQLHPTTSDWSIEDSMWSAAKGYPSAITFHENRLWFGGTASFPDTIWGSAIGDYENFALGTAAADAVQFTFTAREINLIKWLESGNSLLGGTLGGEWRVASSDVENAPITPTDVSVKMQTNYGTADIQPISIGSELIFISKFGDKLRSVSFDSAIDSFISPEISILSEHLLKGGISELAYQKEPFSILWMVRNDGQLVGMSHVKEQESTSFFRRTAGGTDEFESIAVIPGAAYDELWAIVKRTINGATVRYIEVMQKVFDEEDELTDAFFVDSGVYYSGVATTTITGLDHLEGETVQVVANGSEHNNKVVASGQITLDWSSTTAAVGKYNNATLIPNRLDDGAVDGTAQGRVKAVKKHTVRVYRSVAGLIGMEDTDITKMSRIVAKDPRIDDADEPASLFTGDVIGLANPEGYETKGRIKIIQDKPLPMTIIAMMPEVEEE